MRNYQARNMLRDQMHKGDQAFLYHSSTEVPGIVAIMEIVKEGYPDPTAFERKHHHYDPDSDPKNPRWFMVDVQLKRPLARIITLEELRAHAQQGTEGHGAAASGAIACRLRRWKVRTGSSFSRSNDAHRESASRARSRAHAHLAHLIACSLVISIRVYILGPRTNPS